MTFTVTYDGNGATGGSVPVDGTAYTSGDQVTVLGNTGNLSLPGGQFVYWNTADDGSGALQGPGAKFTITSDVTLFAQWLVTDGLPNGGVTTHFTFSYDRALANPGGPEPARTSAVMATVEGDYTLMASWFGGISLTVPVPLQTHVINAADGASWGPPLTLKPGGGDATLVRYLIVSEVTEMFMLAQNQGWFAPDGADEQSCGEGLSRFLAQQFLVLQGLGVIEPGYAVSPHWLNSALPPGTTGSTQLGPVKTTLSAAIDASVTTIPLATGLPIPPFATTWIVQVDSETMLMTAADTGNKTITVQRGYNGTTAAAHAAGANVNDNFGARANYVNLTLEYDNNIDAAIGCSMLFLYYLSVQLGFAIPNIVAAAPGSGHAATCLRGVYRNLTGDSSDPFPFFKQLLDNAFPPAQLATVPGPNPDNPWPLGSLSFWGVKDTWGKDEVTDIIEHSGGTYPDAFWLMLEGFNKQVADAVTPSIPAVAYAGVAAALDPAGTAYETTNPYVPQRIRYPYDVSFAPSIVFPASGETPAAVTSSVSLLGTSLPGGRGVLLPGRRGPVLHQRPAGGRPERRRQRPLSQCRPARVHRHPEPEPASRARRPRVQQRCLRLHPGAPGLPQPELRRRRRPGPLRSQPERDSRPAGRAAGRLLGDAVRHNPARPARQVQLRRGPGPAARHEGQHGRGREGVLPAVGDADHRHRLEPVRHLPQRHRCQRQPAVAAGAGRQPHDPVLRHRQHA